MKGFNFKSGQDKKILSLWKKIFFIFVPVHKNNTLNIYEETSIFGSLSVEFGAHTRNKPVINQSFLSPDTAKCCHTAADKTLRNLSWSTLM